MLEALGQFDNLDPTDNPFNSLTLLPESVLTSINRPQKQKYAASLMSGDHTNLVCSGGSFKLVENTPCRSNTLIPARQRLSKVRFSFGSNNIASLINNSPSASNSFGYNSSSKDSSSLITVNTSNAPIPDNVIVISQDQIPILEDSSSSLPKEDLNYFPRVNTPLSKVSTPTFPNTASNEVVVC